MLEEAMEIEVTDDKTISKIRELVDRFRNDSIYELIEELKEECFEGDVEMKAIIILSSACLTYAKHVQTTILSGGGVYNEVNIDQKTDGSN